MNTNKQGEIDEARIAGKHGGVFDRSSASPEARLAHDEAKRSSTGSNEFIQEKVAGMADALSQNNYALGRIIYLILFLIIPSYFLLPKYAEKISESTKVILSFSLVVFILVGLLFYKLVLPKILAVFYKTIDKIFVSSKTGKVRLGVTIFTWVFIILFFVLLLLIIINP